MPLGRAILKYSFGRRSTALPVQGVVKRKKIAGGVFR